MAVGDIGVTAVLPIICAALLGLFAASFLGLRGVKGQVVNFLVVPVSAAMPVAFVSGSSNISLASATVAAVTSVVIVTVELLILRRALHLGVTVRHLLLMTFAIFPILALSMSGRFFAENKQAVSSGAVIAGIVSTVLILALSARAVNHRFDAVIHGEQANLSPDELASIKRSTYFAVSSIYAAAVLAVVESVIGTTATDGWIAGSSQSIGITASTLVALVTLVLLYVVARRFARVNQSAIHVVSVLWIGIVAWQTLEFGYGNWKQQITSLVVALFASMFVFEGFISNVGYLSGAPKRVKVYFAGTLGALTVGSTIAWVAGPALWSRAEIISVSVSLMNVAIGMVACACLPWLLARQLPGAVQPHRYLLGTPLSGVLQDCYLATILSLTVGWIPNLFLAHLNNVSAWLGAVLPFFALLSAAYVYILKNNVSHVARERIRINGLVTQGALSASDASSVIGNLAVHIQRQNRISLLGLLPIGITLLVSEITGFDRGEMKRIYTL